MRTPEGRDPLEFVLFPPSFRKVDLDTREAAAVLGATGNPITQNGKGLRHFAPAGLINSTGTSEPSEYISHLQRLLYYLQVLALNGLQAFWRCPYQEAGYAVP